MSEETPKGLYSKLVEIMAEVSRVEKRGWNDFHKYAYVMESDLVDMVRTKLTERGILLLPSVDAFVHEDTLTTLSLRFTFIDTESGEKHEAPWVGTGDDKGDKGAYKALTGALKYFLMKTFLIPTGDDPESDVKTDKRGEDKALASQMKCPECGKANAVIKGKEEYGGGWLCFKKKGGCGAKFFDDVPSEDEPTAEITALREAIKKAMEQLNEAGDKPEWTVARVNKMSRESWGKPTADLTAPELSDLATMVSQRLEDIRLKADTDNKAKTDLIASIKAGADVDEIASHLKEHYSGATLESLTLAQLSAIDKALGVPF